MYKRLIHVNRIELDKSSYRILLRDYRTLADRVAREFVLCRESESTRQISASSGGQPPESLQMRTFYSNSSRWTIYCYKVV